MFKVQEAATAEHWQGSLRAELTQAEPKPEEHSDSIAKAVLQVRTRPPKQGPVVFVSEPSHDSAAKPERAASFRSQHHVTKGLKDTENRA